MVLLDYRLLNIFDNAIRNTPTYEIQLGDGRRQTLEIYALGPAERIEQFLRVSVQTRLVRDVDRKKLAVRRLVRHVLVLGVIRYEPFKFSQRRSATSENIV
jgi:hypothetical protein